MSAKPDLHNSATKRRFSSNPYENSTCSEIVSCTPSALAHSLSQTFAVTADLYCRFFPTGYKMFYLQELLDIQSGIEPNLT